jgi:hypothetical protein
MPRVAVVVASALVVIVVGCARGPSPSPPPPPRTECGPLDPATCDAAVVAILATIADPPAAPIRVTFEDGSFCADHLFDGAPCPSRPIPSGATWRGRAELAFGGRYEAAFFDVVAGPEGIEPTLLAIASRPPAPPTD